jgi:acetylornithine aminotransferase
MIKPDIICMAKGMGNGFPIGGILIAPHFKASYGLLGTTFAEVIWLAQQVSLF